jgi:competence protein ComEC
MTRPLLGLAGALAVGCWLGQGLARVPSLALLGLGALLLALGLRARGTAWPWAAVGAAALAIGAAGAGVEGMGYDAAGLRAAVPVEIDTPVLVEGRIARDPWTVADRSVLLVDVTGLERGGARLEARGGARITVGGTRGLPELRAGDRVSVWATLRPPRGYANPGSPDAVARARREGLHALGTCKSALLVRRLAPGQGTVTALAGRVRAWARGRISAHVPAGPEEALVRAMVLGDRSGVDPETGESFRIAGTYHVLALSGAQVALVAGALLWGLRRLEAPRALTAILVCVALAFYAAVVGGEVPIVRAVVMAGALLLGWGLDLDSDLPNLLGLAALALLTHSPSSVGDVSFQLSFGATLGILLLAPPLARRLPALPLRLDLAVAASVAAQVALAPLLAAHFHRLAPAALVLNLVAVPLSGAVLLTGVLVLALAPVSSLVASLAGDAAFCVAHALLRSADVVRIAPWLDVRVPGPSPMAGSVYAAGLLLALSPGSRRLGCACLALGLALVLVPMPPDPDGRLHVTVLDVGQGDAIVIRTPEGRTWLVDAGAGGPGRRDLGEGVVAPYLWWAGARRLEGFVLSHAHPDHVGGAAAVIRAFPVGAVWEGLAPRRDAGYSEFDRLLRGTATVRVSVARGFRADWDGVAVEVLAPAPPVRPPWTARNDDSLVLALRYGDVTLVLAGDVEEAGESRLMPPRADLLKVPHHGSRTSSSPAFLAAARPRLAVVSAGFRNRYGHPHPEVLERYRRLGCLLLRTDRDGAISVSTDGRELRVTTFNGLSGRAPAGEGRTPRGL